MRAGPLRHRIAIQERGTMRGSLGVPKGWTTIKNLKASVGTPRASETFQQGRLQPIEIYTFTTRYTRGVQSDMRILFGTETYEIENVLNVDGLNLVTEITARRLSSKQFGRA